MASVWVPFTSESKEAIADYDEIRKEMKLALQECGRKLGSYVRKRDRIRREGQRRDAFARYIGEVARALHTIDPDLDPATVRDDLEIVAASRTELADVTLDEDGLPIDQTRNGKIDENTVILDLPGEDAPPPALEPTPEAPKKKTTSKKKTARKSPAKKKAVRRRTSTDGQEQLFGD